MKHPGSARAARRRDERRIRIGKGAEVRPDELAVVNLKRTQNTGDDAQQHGSEQHVSPGILDILAERTDAVKAHVGEHRDRCAGADERPRKGPRIIERLRGKQSTPSAEPDEIPGGHNEERHEHHAHARREQGVGSRVGLDTAQIQPGEERRKENHPDGKRDRQNVHGRLGAPNGSNRRVEDVVEGDAPAGQESKMGMQLVTHVAVGRPSLRISSRHPPIADRGEHHGDHRDQQRGRDVSLRHGGDDSERAQRRGRLDDDDAVEQQVTELQDAAQPARGWAHGTSRIV